MPWIHLFTLAVSRAEPVGTAMVPWQACSVAQRGFHILQGEGCGVSVWRDSLRSASPLSVAVQQCPEDYEALPRKVEEALGLGHLEPHQQRWRYFSPQGRPLEDSAAWAEALRAGAVFLLEGGQFRWPPVQVGFRQDAGAGVELETLALSPSLFRVRGLISDGEIEDFVDFAQPRLVKSSGVWEHQGGHRERVRVSVDYRPPHNATPLIAALEARTAALARTPLSHLEVAQIVSYDTGGYYWAHDDAGRIDDYYGDELFMQRRHYGHFSRMLTLFWYLSDVPKGGATNFPRADTDRYPKTMRSCVQGLMVPPKRGTAILWYNLDPRGWVDPKALHAACAVEAGKKLAMNIWVRNKPSSTPLAKWDPDHPRLRALRQKRGEL